jgi:hypothetical protein
LRGFPEIDARVQEIPAEIATEWPGARRVSLALGDALHLSLPPSAHAMKRLRQAAWRLVREPEVQEAARRAVAIARRWDPTTEERDRDLRHRLIFERQARLFAAARRLSFLSPRDAMQLLASYFGAVYRDDDWSPPSPEGVEMFVNPLADAPLSASVAPGHILVDVTHVQTDDDLLALRPALQEARRRMRYDKRGGGPNPFCVENIRLAIRQFKGVDPPGVGEVARLVYGSHDSIAARDAYRKCLGRANKRHEDILREEGWPVADR